MPIGLVLINLGGLNDVGVIERATDELKAHGQAMIAEAARHADGGEAAEISDAADWITE